MTSLFLFGTLCHAPLLAIVLGRAPALTPATLAGFRAVWAKEESFPFLIPQTQARAEGVLLEGLSAEDIARLDYYEGAFHYRLKPHQVETADGPVTAQVYTPDNAPWRPGADWSLADWVRDWGELTCLAAEEVMRGFGHVAPTGIAARFPIIRARAQAVLRARARHRPARHSAGFTRADVTLERNDIVYEKFFRLSEAALTHRSFGDRAATRAERAVYQVAEAVTLLPYDPIRDRVLLVEQFRVGAYFQGDPQPWMLEPVAGIVDAGETLEDSARREAWEEARVDVSTLHKIAGYYPTPGGVAQVLTSYLGVADLPDLGERTIAGLADEAEDIRSFTLSFSDLMALVESGEANNAPLIISAQWLALNRARLRAEAGGDHA